MAAKTVAERMSEADQLMRSGLGLTVIADIGSDTLQVHDPLGMPMAGQPASAKILDVERILGHLTTHRRSARP